MKLSMRNVLINCRNEHVLVMTVHTLRMINVILTIKMYFITKIGYTWDAGKVGEIKETQHDFLYYYFFADEVRDIWIKYFINSIFI